MCESLLEEEEVKAGEKLLQRNKESNVTKTRSRKKGKGVTEVRKLVGSKMRF